MAEPHPVGRQITDKVLTVARPDTIQVSIRA